MRQAAGFSGAGKTYHLHLLFPEAALLIEGHVGFCTVEDDLVASLLLTVAEQMLNHPAPTGMGVSGSVMYKPDSKHGLLLTKPLTPDCLIDNNVLDVTNLQHGSLSA